MKHKSEVSPWLLQSPVFGSEKIMYLDCFLHLGYVFLGLFMYTV